MLHFINNQVSHETQEGLVRARFFTLNESVGAIVAVPTEELVRIVVVSPPMILDIHEGDLPSITSEDAGRTDRFTERVNNATLAGIIICKALQVTEQDLRFVHT